MPASPTDGSAGVVTLKITSDGSPIPDTLLPISVRVGRQANTVPWARLEFRDGDMPNQTFPGSDGSEFAPGKAIAIEAGYGGQAQSIFSGVIVKHAVRVAGDNDSRLIIECRDKAVAMTVGRKNANFDQKTDSDVISAVAGTYGLTVEVDATTLQHPAVVQHHCTDWDFVLARAEANGMLVIAEDGTLKIKTPDGSAAAALKVTYGQDLYEFDAEVDARSQFSSVQAVGWDPSSQAIVEGTAASPGTLAAQGNLSGSALAEVLGLALNRLQVPVPLDAGMLTAWAKAVQTKATLARVRGQVRFQGSALATVGGVIELAGVGARFSGTAFITGLQHEIVDGDWVTQARFGMAPGWLTEQPDVVAPYAGGLAPGVHGLQVGKVMKLDADPQGQHRVQVSIPVPAPQTDGVWARLLKLHASNGFGAFFVPEVGDEVVLGYFDGDPAHPVVLGSLYSSSRPPPYELAAENNTKAIVTRCLSKLEFDEDKKTITLITPAKNQVVLDDTDKSILVKDQTGNQVKLSTSGIEISSPKDIKITAQGGITMEATNAISIKSQADVKASGLNVSCEAQVGFTGKGSATAELSASGQTTVKGAMVMIN